MKKNYKTILILVIIIVFFTRSLIDIKTIIREFLDYTNIFIKNVFPTSFIFILISTLLSEYQLIYFFQKITRIKSIKIYYLLMSIISGFPAGIILIKDGLDNNTISLEDANYLVRFCHFPNPLFIFYTFSSSINSLKDTIIIYSIYIISNIIILIIVPVNNNITITINNYKSFSKVLNRSINKTFKTIILIYGTSIMFYLLSIPFQDFTINNIYLYTLTNGIFDLTKGVLSLSLLNSILVKGIFGLLFISIGSFAIIIQIKSILEDTSISFKSFIFGRILSVLISVNIWIVYFCCFRVI